MEVIDKKEDGFVVFELRGRLDTAHYLEVEKRLNEAVVKGNSRIIVDLTSVDYISSSGLRVLLLILKKVKELDGNIVLFGLNENLKEVFEISGFNKFFSISDSYDGAKAALFS